MAPRVVAPQVVAPQLHQSLAQPRDMGVDKLGKVTTGWKGKTGEQAPGNSQILTPLGGALRGPAHQALGSKTQTEA